MAEEKKIEEEAIPEDENREQEDENDEIIVEGPGEISSAEIERQLKEAKSADSGEEEDDVEGKKKESPKPVDGETPRERAIRKELQIERKKRRTSETKAALESRFVKTPHQSEEKIAKLKELYGEEELNKFEDVFETIAENRGYVKKSQQTQDVANDLLNDFIDSHPEYDAKNDPDDVRWNSFLSELSLYDLSKVSSAPREFKKIYEKAHKSVMEELGEPENSTNDKKIEAQRQKIKSVSHTGGTMQSSKSKPKFQMSPEVRSRFKGFDDEDFA